MLQDRSAQADGHDPLSGSRAVPVRTHCPPEDNMFRTRDRQDEEPRLPLLSAWSSRLFLSALSGMFDRADACCPRE